MLEDDLINLKNIQKEIKFLTNSDNRLRILDCLFKSPQTIKEIHEKTKLNYSSISVNISSLEEKGYVENLNDVFYLTNNSKLILTNVFYLNTSVNLLDKNSEFLNKHKLDNLKFNAFKDLSSLESLELVEATPLDIHKTTRLIKELGDSSKSVKTIFPFIYPQINEVLTTWFVNDIDIKLILDKDVSEAFIETFNNYEFNNESNSKIAVKTIDDGLDFALLLADDGIILGFNKEDGKFDQNALYISKEKDAIDWANDIFEEYEKLAPEYIYLKE